MKYDEFMENLSCNRITCTKDIFKYVKKYSNGHLEDIRSYLDKDGNWNIYPIGSNSNSIFIVCPYCGDIHIHGHGSGHRISHCFDNHFTSINNGYIIHQ